MLPIPWGCLCSAACIVPMARAHHLHFITCSCYRRLPFLRSARARDRFLVILEQTRRRYRFVVVGYVVMPEHVHLLITEPDVGRPSTVMQVLKQRTARALLPKRRHRDRRQRKLFGEEPQRAFWQARFYDFNVWTAKKRVEKNSVHFVRSCFFFKSRSPSRITRVPPGRKASMHLRIRISC